MTEGTVVVTGAGGFVGSAIVRRLVLGGARFADGRNVEHVVALLSPSGSDERLETLPPEGSWSLERADVTDGDDLRVTLQRLRPRAIVHAALADAAYREVDESDDGPLVGRPLAALVESLRGVSGARFLHVGSAWVLRSGVGLDEAAPIDPRTPYAHNKARADALVPVLAERAGVPWINLRLFNMFGRYEKPSRLVPTLVSKLARGDVAELTHGEQVRDFTDVDVMAGVFVSALAAPDSACGALYHVGSGRGTTVRELALEVARCLGRPHLVSFGAAKAADEDLPQLVADPSLASRRLGWRPDLDLETRVRAAVDWWLERLEAEVAR